MSKVIFVRGTDPYENTLRILKQLKTELVEFIRSPVLIKPNLVYDKKLPGVTTDPLVVKAIVDFLTDTVKPRIIIGEGSAFDTENAFENLGYNEMFEEYPLKLVDLNSDESVDMKLIDMRTGDELSVPIAKTALDSKFVISCALLKTHDFGIGTFALKNMLGTICGGAKSKVHGVALSTLRGEDLKAGVRRFHENIFRVVRRVTPGLAIIDGTVGLEGNGPVSGSPKSANLALGSIDPVAADAVAAYLIGFDPYEIGYIYYCEKAGLGTADLARIQVSAPEWFSARQRFTPHKDYPYMTFVPEQ